MAQKGDPHAWSRAARSGASDSEPEPQLMPLLATRGAKTRARKLTTGASADRRASAPLTLMVR